MSNNDTPKMWTPGAIKATVAYEGLDYIVTEINPDEVPDQDLADWIRVAKTAFEQIRLRIDALPELDEDKEKDDVNKDDMNEDENELDELDEDEDEYDEDELDELYEDEDEYDEDEYDEYDEYDDDEDEYDDEDDDED